MCNCKLECCMCVFYAWYSYVRQNWWRSIGDCNDCNCNVTLGRPVCDRLVVADLVVDGNCKLECCECIF